MEKRSGFNLGFVLMLLLPIAGWSQNASEIISNTGIEQGICLHVGLADQAEFAIAMAQGEKFLVHGLVTQPQQLEAARAKIQEAGLYGIASMEAIESVKTLPYPENFTNLLVIDLDALGNDAPPQNEIERVIVPKPYGAAIVKKGGKWETITKDRHSQMDDWTHYAYGPEGNVLSQDGLVHPKTSLKWVSWYSSRGYGKSQTHGMRSENGILVHEQQGFEGTQALTGRDAFNGITYWRKMRGRAGSKDRYLMLMKKGVLYTVFSEERSTSGTPMQAYDAYTGNLKREFSNAGKWGSNDNSLQLVDAIYSDDVIYQVAEKTIYSINPATGDVNWSKTENAGERLEFPVTNSETELIFYTVMSDKGNTSRWYGAHASAIVARKKSNGEEVWRNTEVSGSGVANLIYHKNKVVYFCGNGIGALSKDVDADVGVIDAQTGNTIWSKNYDEEVENLSRDEQKEWGRMSFAFQPLIREDDLWIMNQSDAWKYDLEKGDRLEAIRPHIVNQRCPRPVSTKNFMIIGFGSWYDPVNNKWTYQNVSRGDCATYTMPANGMSYATPNECTCFAQLRGMAGFSSENVAVPIPDQKRVEGPGFKRSSAPAKLASALAKSTASYQVAGVGFIASSSAGMNENQWDREPVFTGSPLRDMWHNTDNHPTPVTESVTANGRTFVGIVNEHRLEAKQNGEAVWSFTAGGRISRAPVVHSGMVFFGSHDGYVYALNETDGTLKWRFLAAPGQRKVMAFGQIESSWPVYGVVVHKGKIAVSAGRHPEVDGGIYLYGLEPETGDIAWKGRLGRFLKWHENFSRDIEDYRGWENHIINTGLKVEGDKLILPGSHYVSERFPASSVEIVPDNPPSTGIPGNSLSNTHVRSIKLISGILQIEFAPEGSAGEIRIFDMHGKVIMGMQGKYRNIHHVPVSQLSAGKYLVVVNTPNSNWNREFTIAGK